jgi:hypothetical protein
LASREFDVPNTPTTKFQIASAGIAIPVTNPELTSRTVDHRSTG